MISRKLGRRGALILGSATAATVLIAGAAWAYWTARASDVPTYSYADSVGTGTTPTASVSGTAVTLTWPATTTVAGHPVEGYLINRYPTASGGTATSACAAPVTTTSCTETNVPTGTWYYTTTPVLKSWRGNESSRGTGAVVNGTTAFTLSASGPLTAGTPATLTITAKAGSQTDPGYTGSKPLTFTGPGAAPNGTAPTYPTSATFTNGIATVPITLYRAENPTLTVQSGTITGSLGLTVNPGTATQFRAPAPTFATAGAPFTLTLTAQDPYQNTATTHTGSKPLTFTGPGAAPNGTAPTYPATATFTNGTTTAQITLYRAESTTLTVQSGSITGSTPTLTVAPNSATQLAIPTPATQTAGAPFTLTINALDAYQNTAASYTGSKPLAFTGPSPSPSGTTPAYPSSATFMNGTATASITLYRAENTGLTVQSGATAGSTATFTVNQGTATKLAWSTVTTTGTLGTPCLFTCTASNVGNGGTFTANVSATDNYGNVGANLGAVRTVTLTTPAGGGSFLPSGTTITRDLPAGGPSTTAQFTFKGQNGNFTDNFTATATGLDPATATVNSK